MTTSTRVLLAVLLIALAACSDENASKSLEPGKRASAAQVEPPPAPGPAAEHFSSGLVMTWIHRGGGATPSASSRVRVHYHGRLMDGTVFDSSVERGEPALFPLDRVIPCWTEALQKMKVGGKAEIICPPEIAYGAPGRPPVIPPNATLHFEVELLGIL